MNTRKLRYSTLSIGSKHQSSGAQNSRTRLLLNINIVCTPESNKNIIAFIIPFDIYNYSNGVFYKLSSFITVFKHAMHLS